MANIKTFVALIVDESGSMKSIQKQSIDNFNEQLQTLKSESNSPDAVAKKLLIGGQQYDGVETHVSVVKFNDKVNVVVPLAEVNTVNEITVNDYNPDGSTALYQAIGETISRFQNITDMSDPTSSALFIIITDGQNNVHGKYTREEVKSLIDELTASGRWTFTFMGTENALDQAEDLGIAKGNMAAFAATNVGMATASDLMTSSLRSYYDARRSGTMSVSSFYDEDDKDKNV